MGGTDIGLFRKKRVLLQLWAMGFQVNRSQIIDKKDGMGIADIHTNWIPQGAGVFSVLKWIFLLTQTL